MLDPIRWQAVSAHLDEVLDLDEAARADWIAELHQRDPAIATEVRRRPAPLRPNVAWPATRRAALAPTGTDGLPYVSWIAAPRSARSSAGQQ